MSVNNEQEKKEKVGLFTKMKNGVKAWPGKHPKICKAAKIVACTVGAGCTIFTGACVASVVSERLGQPPIEKITLEDGTEIINF